MWNVIIEGISPHLVAGRIMGRHGRDVCRSQVARSKARAAGCTRNFEGAIRAQFDGTSVLLKCIIAPKSRPP
jgi:hypothetical protein